MTKRALVLGQVASTGLGKDNLFEHELIRKSPGMKWHTQNNM